MLESILKSFNIDVINTLIILSILITFAIGIWFSYKKIFTDFVNFIPTLFTTIGIFGTFLGIVLGLLHFDQTNIETSFPPLLDGLKTAFISSIVGIFASLVFKTLSTFSFFNPKDEEEYKVTPKMLLTTMQAQVDEIAKLKNAIISHEETALFGQIKGLRADINSNAKLSIRRSESHIKLQQQNLTQFSQQLWNEFQQISTSLSETATKQIIEALRQVIADFNHNLTEQFGHNFKYFNEGIKNSIQWQENYKVQFEQMQQLYAQAVESLLVSEASLAQVNEQSQQIPKTMTELKNIINVNQYQIEELEKNLEAFSIMKNNAIEAVPLINQYLQSTIQDLGSTMNLANEYHNNLLVESERYIHSHINISNQFLEKFGDETNKGLTQIQSMNHNLIDDVELVKNNLINSTQLLERRLLEIINNLAEQQFNQSQQVFKSLESNMANQAEITSQNIESQLAHIDAAMKQEINTVMSEMGNAISQISNQFVNDYSKLTQRVVHNIDQQVD